MNGSVGNRNRNLLESCRNPHRRWSPVIRCLLTFMCFGVLFYGRSSMGARCDTRRLVRVRSSRGAAGRLSGRHERTPLQVPGLHVIGGVVDFTAGNPLPYTELDFHFVPFSPNDGNGQTKFKDGAITYIATADGTVTVWQVGVHFPCHTSLSHALDRSLGGGGPGRDRDDG